MFPRFSFHALDAACLAASAAGILVFASWLATRPQNPLQDGVAVLFPPWMQEGQVLAKALEPGARIVRSAGLGFIAIVMPDDEGYAARVRMAGAWAVLDPRALGTCARSPAASL